MHSFLRNIIHSLHAEDFAGSDPETISDRMELVLGVISRLDENSLPGRLQILTLLQRARAILEEISMEIENTYRTPLLSNGNAGRPSYDIPVEQLQYLVEKGSSVPDISLIIGVSVRTIRRRLQQQGILLRGLFSQLSDGQLDAIVGEVLNDFPNCGYRRMDGFLRSKGHKVQQIRIRESVKRVDPEGVLLRSLELNVVQRRSYNVTAPMALWHVDGYHKLIR